jgi:hypothetical protein
MNLVPLLRHLKLVMQQTVLEYALTTEFLNPRRWLTSPGSPVSSHSPPMEPRGFSTTAPAASGAVPAAVDGRALVGACRALSLASALCAPYVCQVRMPCCLRGATRGVFVECKDW